jgi:hypothetical protein
VKTHCRIYCQFFSIASTYQTQGKSLPRLSDGRKSTK